MGMKRRLGLLAIACLFVSGCTSAVASAAPTSPTANPPSPTPTPTPSPTLPTDPVLVATTTTDALATYQIAIAPSSMPLDETSARARATKIGALVGLAAPDAVYQSDVAWMAIWGSQPGQSCPAPTCIDGVPIDPSYPAIQLEMDANGIVLAFSRTLGPTEPKPAHVISEAEARKAAGGKPDRATLIWAREPSGSETFRLVWRLDYARLQPDGETWPCAVWLDAGSGAQLNAACVS